MQLSRAEPPGPRRADDIALPVGGPDQPLFRQHRHRPAHRRPADAQMGGNGGLFQKRTGRHLSRLDLLFQKVAHGIVQEGSPGKRAWDVLCLLAGVGGGLRFRHYKVSIEYNRPHQPSLTAIFFTIPAS